MKKNKTHLTKKKFNFFLETSRVGLFLSIILLYSFTSLSGQRPFVTVWNTNINNDNSKHIRFITEGSFLYSYVNVNDSSISSVGQSTGGDVIIDFPQTGNYRLSIVPSSQFRFNSKVTVYDDPEAKKLISVSQWGDINWKPNLSQMFWYCTNLNIDATDIPDFQNVTNMYSMFAECSKLKTVSGINNWNVGNVTNMSYMFFKNSLFNQSFSNWNVSNVTNMEAMFSFASTFNQPIGSWNVSKVTNMRGMFRDTSSFNQPLENWNVENVVDMYVMFYNAQSFNQSLQNWNVSKVTNMGGMFVNSKKFNQPVGSWNVSNVTTMEHMFSGATAFNQDLGNWNLKSINLISNSDGFNSLHNFFDSSGMDCQNYMKTLKGWSENVNTPNNLNFGVGGVRYGLDGKTYRDLLINSKGWNIVGDLYSTICNSSLAITDISKDVIQIYPNPFTDKFTINFKNINSKNVTVKIYNSTGILVSDRKYISSKAIEVIGNHLPVGTYNVTISFDKTFKSFKLIRQ